MTINLEIMGGIRGDPHDNCEALFDTGAGITLFSDAFVRRLRGACPAAIVLAQPPNPAAMAACGAGGQPLEMMEDVCLRVRVGGVVELVWGHVVRGLAIPMLLGTGTQTQWGAIIDVPRQQVWLGTQGVTIAASTTPPPAQTAEAVAAVGGAVCPPVTTQPDGAPLPGDVLRVVAVESRVIPAGGRDAIDGQTYETKIEGVVIAADGRVLRTPVHGFVQRASGVQHATVEYAEHNCNYDTFAYGCRDHTTAVLHGAPILVSPGATATYERVNAQDGGVEQCVQLPAVNPHGRARDPAGRRHRCHRGADG